MIAYIARGAGDEAKPHIGSRLANRASGCDPLELGIERSETRIGIDTQVEGELPARRTASGDGCKHTLLVRIGRLDGGFGAAKNVAYPA